MIYRAIGRASPGRLASNKIERGLLYFLRREQVSMSPECRSNKVDGGRGGSEEVDQQRY